MQAQRVLFISSVVFFFFSVVNCEDPKATYRKWGAVLESQKKEGAQIPIDSSSECRGSPEETLSWIYLRNLFFLQKDTGILRYAWPRLSFYSEALKALTETPSLKDLLLCEQSYAISHVCLESKCKSCSDNYEEIKATNEPTLIQICDKKFPDPEKAEVSEERRKELERLWKPPVASPGELGWEEATSWIEMKLEKKEKVAKKEEDDCDAPPQLTMSFAYLRRMWEERANTTEKTRRELGSHPEFYAEKLKWLKGADKEIVPCAEGLVCGWDGVCVKCGDAKDPGNLGLEESCFLAEAEDWEDWNNIPSVSKFGAPLEAYRSWVAALAKVKKRSVVKDAEEKSCNVSVEQTISYSYLTSLFYVFQADGVMAHAWPRILFYDQKLEEVLNAPEDVVFCDWRLGVDATFLCLNGQCKECSELTGIGYGSELYRKRCVGVHGEPEELPEKGNKMRQKEAEKMRRVEPPLNPMNAPLTFEAALSWNESLQRTGITGSLGECSAMPYLTLAVKVLLRRVMKVKAKEEAVGWRWKTRDEVKAEVESNRTRNDWQLSWLVGAEEKTRVVCGEDVVCGAEGLCVPCAAAVVTREAGGLKKACEVEVQERTETEESESGARGDRKWGALMIFGALLGLLLF